MKANGNLMVIVSGASSVGKSRTIKALCEINPIYRKVISETTRFIRKEEVNGCDYDFVSETEFCERIYQKKYVTWKKSQYGFYGLSFDRLRDAEKDDKIPVIDMDVDAYIEMKRQMFYVVGIFLLPDKLETIKIRLNTRGAERGIASEVDAKARFSEAVKMIDYIEVYDYAITNLNDIDTAKKIDEIVKVELIRREKSFLISNMKEDAAKYKLQL